MRITFEHLDPRILPDMGVKVAFLAEKKSAQAHRNRRPRRRFGSAVRAVQPAGWTIGCVSFS